jgi:superkiller protein 3
MESPVFSRVCALRAYLRDAIKDVSSITLASAKRLNFMRARYIGWAFWLTVVLALAASAQTSHIETATQLLNNGDTEHAEAEARKALQIPSARALALAMLGTIRLQQGQTEESIKFLTQALALNPKMIGARTTLGNAYAFSNQPDLAAKSFRQVLDLDPSNLNARFDLFKLEASRQNFQKSLDVTTPILPQLLVSDEGLVVLATDYGALGKKKELEDVVAYWHKLPEPSDESALDFASTLLVYGMKTEAISVLEDQEKRLKGHAQTDTTLRLANAFLAVGLVDDAERNAQRALSQKAECTACYRMLAQIAEHQGDGEKALSYLVRAKQLSPQDPEVLFEFGRVCLERNLLDDALPALSKAVELRPDNDAYVYALGSANVGKQHLADALQLFQQLLKKHPQDASLMYAIGAVYYLESKFTEAESLLKQSLATQPNQTGAAYYLALTYDAMGDDERAVPIFRDLLKRNPQHAPSYVKLGGILVRQHQYEEAQRDLEQAVSLDPNSVEAHYQLGVVLRRVGKSAESETQFAESRRLETEQSAQRDLHLRLLLPD